MSDSIKAWTQATSEIPWGVQRTLVDTLTLVGEEKIQLVHGADYRNGKPCLINAVAQMTTVGGGQGIPSANFGRLVGCFDRLNAQFVESKVNANDGYVSPLAAEILLKNFGPLKARTENKVDDATLKDLIRKQAETAVMDAPYSEPTDAEMMSAWQDAISKPTTQAPELNEEFFASYTEAIRV